MDPLTAFAMLDIRVGCITRAESNAQATKPAYKLWIDFGALGTKTSSAQLTELYQPEDLQGKMIMAVTNLGAKKIAGFTSEVLVLGVPDAEGRIVLLAPESDVPPGGKVF